MRHTEPPSCPNFPTFLIGRNGRGNWVVRDQSGARGGLFIGRAEALRYAMFENGNQPQAVIMVPGVLELALSDAGGAAADHPVADRIAHHPRQFAA